MALKRKEGLTAGGHSEQVNSSEKEHLPSSYETAGRVHTFRVYDIFWR